MRGSVIPVKCSPHPIWRHLLKRQFFVSLSFFVVSSALICLSVYVLIPFFMDRWSLLFGEAYLFCFYAPFALLFVAALVYYRLEGNPWSWKAFAARMRLGRLDRRTLLLTLLLFVYSLGSYFLLTSTFGAWLARSLSFISVPSWFPGGLDPNKAMAPGSYLDVPMRGRYLFLLAGLVGWFFNIAGEELLFRGMLLPREESAFGRHAWVFQGTVWALWHIFWWWNVLPLMVGVTLPFCFLVSRRRNTWMGIIVHGSMNLIPFIAAAVAL
jgi:membrane protease YdiL (CAAX protease family)